MFVSDQRLWRRLRKAPAVYFFLRISVRIGSGGGFGKHQPNFRIAAFELVEAKDQRVIFLGLFKVVRMTLVGPMRTNVCV